MAASKKIGFYWGDEKITVVELDKNAPVNVLSAPLGSKTSPSTPFSSNLTEEIQITVVLKKLLEENNIQGGVFFVSLPMKEIILRSFVIPFVKPEDVQNAVKFEAKKFIPFDIQDLSFVFHTIPFTEGTNKRLQVIFFAARREVLARYERIFKQVNATISYAEPYIVSLSKALLFRKEISSHEHVAFLILEKNLGRICFIDKGIPQFIREFPVSMPATEEVDETSGEALNMKIVNEVLNSFDFYTRQFSGEKIESIMISSDMVLKDLAEALEAEAKLKAVKFSPAIETAAVGHGNDMDAIYAMGAGVAAPMESLAKFNFISGDKAPKVVNDSETVAALKPYMDMIVTAGLCAVFLIGLFVFFQMQLKIVSDQYGRLASQEGADLNNTSDVIQTQIQQNVQLLTQYKSVRTTSDISAIMVDIAGHFPVGSMLDNVKINYEQSPGSSDHLVIDLQGEVHNEGPNQQIQIVNQIYSDFKNDKNFSKYVQNVVLVSMTHQDNNGATATGFTLHCS